jgi:hypothetical protein
MVKLGGILLKNGNNEYGYEYVANYEQERTRIEKIFSDNKVNK